VSSVAYLTFLAYLVGAARFLSVSSAEYRIFGGVTLFVNCAFLLSLAPIWVTVASVRTMSDQFTMVLIAIFSLVLLVLATGLRVGVRALVVRKKLACGIGTQGCGRSEVE
jgi:hypothetical protein